jgi:hypothetical protein
VDFVKQKERVVAEQSGVDRTHDVAYPVAAKQQTGADLVDCRYGDEGLIGSLRPRIVTRNSTAELGARERFASLAQRAKPIAHCTEDTAGGVSERARNELRAFERLINDRTPIDDHDDSPWRAALAGRTRGVEREVKDSDIDRCGLPGSRR